MKTIKRLVFAVGAFKIGAYAYDLGYQVYQRNYVEPYNLKERYGESSYALVTGSTDGFGKSYARELARRGLNLVLVARNAEKLEKTKQEIQNEFGVAVETIKYDFLNSPNYETLLEIDKKTRNLDISVLVNNVGAFASGNFVDITPKELSDLIAVNIYPVTFLTHAFARRFTKRGQRSAIINVGSEAGEVPYPYLQAYAATKAYDNMLTLSLREEIKDKVDVVAHLPGPSTTPMNDEIAGKLDLNKHKLFFDIFGKLFVGSHEDSVISTLNQLGHSHYVAGSARHTLTLEATKAFGPLSVWYRTIHGKLLVDVAKVKPVRDW